MKSTPLITIVLPVYNGSRYLSTALDAILSQTYKNFELIVVDDCSTDTTPKILTDYSFQDSRIRTIRNETNLKLPTSLNVGHQAGRGSFFTWTSDDNIPHSDWLWPYSFAPYQFKKYRPLYGMRVSICGFRLKTGMKKRAVRNRTSPFS